MGNRYRSENGIEYKVLDEPIEDDVVSESSSNALLCGCNGCPVKGAVCNYVTVGGKYCKAPTDYDCEYKKADRGDLLWLNV
jgi:hypothetical protein